MLVKGVAKGGLRGKEINNLVFYLWWEKHARNTPHTDPASPQRVYDHRTPPNRMGTSHSSVDEGEGGVTAKQVLEHCKQPPRNRTG